MAENENPEKKQIRKTGDKTKKRSNSSKDRQGKGKGLNPAATVPVGIKHTERVTKVLPESFKEDTETNHFVEYAKANFVEQKVGSFFNKRVLTMDEAVQFSDTPVESCLLKKTPQTHVKTARLMHKNILMYTNVRPSKVAVGSAISFLSLFKDTPELLEEAYAQLIKQSTNAPKDTMKAVLELILITVTIFTPPEEIRPYLVSHLARCLSDSSQSTEKLAAIAYFRTLTISPNHNNVYPGDAVVSKILPQIEAGTMCFQVSLYEIMYHQYFKCPRLLVPYPMYEMIERLFQIGCEKQNGIFRVVGNLKNLDLIREKANQGDEYLEGLNVVDTSSVFKGWCRDISGGIIDQKYLQKLINKPKTETHVEYANKLPTLTKHTLMYLVGFLRKLSLSEAITLMDVPNLAMVFSMNIVEASDDPTSVSIISTQCAALLRELIQSWDVSEVYPLPSGALVGNNEW